MMASSFPRLYQPDAGSITAGTATKKCLYTLPNVSRGQTHPQLRTSGLRAILSLANEWFRNEFRPVNHEERPACEFFEFTQFSSVSQSKGKSLLLSHWLCKGKEEQWQPSCDHEENQS